MDCTAYGDDALRSAIKTAEDFVWRQVASVHGTLNAADCERLDALRDEFAKRGLKV